ncbi:hypothetical protein [Streptomyces sp. NPDC058622]|uniref:hypothetical protein n=1 Tax=Streptomyces sp. NPDC058622 TaxID=3346562 RepID=UPI00365F4D67
MTTSTTTGTGATSDDRSPVHPSLSEAGRLLCAGTYLDSAYRDRVIEELYVHEERIVAPSYGFDAARVLAHALRARRAELGWAAGVVFAWFAGVLLTGGALLVVAVPFLLLGIAGWLTSRGRGAVGVLSRVAGALVRLWAWLLLLVLAVAALGSGVQVLVFLRPLFWLLDALGLAPLLYAGGGGLLESWTGLGVLAAFGAVATVVGLQRGHVARVILHDLDRNAYARPDTDPAEQAVGVRFARAQERIRHEQHSRLVMYGFEDPFRGAGLPYRPWHLAVELRPRSDRAAAEPPELVDNARILERIRPRLEGLRLPTPHGSPRAQAAVRDRLRELVVDECVFLPAAGLPGRLPELFRPEVYEAHRADAVEEGGEQRRHFLRIRVGGWDENLVVTVFVRVHTQGRMLMLEVAPHVLLPVDEVFQAADDFALRHRNNNPFAKAVSAVGRTPRSLGASLATLFGGTASVWRVATAGHRGALPAGPGLSVREIAAQPDGSLFHLMDLDRYLKTIQERVAGGVKETLHEAGWHTDEFDQRLVHVAEGGVFIQSMNHSAFSVGGSGNSNRTSHHTHTNGSNGSGR